jgi:hypothetical protein
MTFYAGALPNPGSTNTRIANTTATVVVASAGQSQSVAKVNIANVDGADAVVVTVDIFDTNATKIVNLLSLAAAGGYLELRDILLDQGQSLRVTSGDADGQLHVHAIHSLTNIPGA